MPLAATGGRTAGGTINGGASGRPSAVRYPDGVGMKSRIKAVSIVLGLLLALPLLAWMATLLYWHVRISMALRAWEKDPSLSLPTDLTPTDLTDGRAKSSRTIHAAGCRALPS